MLKTTMYFNNLNTTLNVLICSTICFLNCSTIYCIYVRDIYEASGYSSKNYENKLVGGLIDGGGGGGGALFNFTT